MILMNEVKTVEDREEDEFRGRIRNGWMAARCRWGTKHA